MILLDLVDLSYIKENGTSGNDPIGFDGPEYIKEEGTSGDDPLGFGGL